MKKLFGLALFINFATLHAIGQVAKEKVTYNPNAAIDTTKKSIKAIAVGIVNGDSIKITYHSPAVRERIIWGGLVPFGEVWVTGAHDATLLEIRNPIVVNGAKIPAGKYALFTIPGRDEWTVIINKTWQQHLAWDYAEKDDIVRVKVKPLENKHTERLQYFVENINAKGGNIAIAWEKLKIEFPFTLEK